MVEVWVNHLRDAAGRVPGVVSRVMNHVTLRPVFAAFRVSLHLMVVALTALPVAHAFVAGSPTRWLALGLGLTVLAIYCCGAVVLGSGRKLVSMAWLCCLSAVWLGLTIVDSTAAYLVFPVFFLYQHVLDRVWGVICVSAATLATVVVVGMGSGWTIGGIIGPIVGAGVAVLIGWGYQLIIDESTERERLISELVATRDRLAASEREAGALEERERLAREIHDTIAQGLSSIQMFLYAAERADPDRPGGEHIALARQVAADNLAEARRFIRELSPAALEKRDLGSALRRLANSEWAVDGRTVTVDEVGDAPMSMDAQTALLRIAQGAMANVSRHSHAAHAAIRLRHEGDSISLEVVDDGVGFTVDAPRSGLGHQDSFGLTAIRERVEQLGGTTDVRSALGAGTTVRVELGVREAGVREVSARERGMAPEVGLPEAGVRGSGLSEEAS